MTLKGISKLPLFINDKAALNIYKKLASINTKIGKLNSELAHT